MVETELVNRIFSFESSGKICVIVFSRTIYPIVSISTNFTKSFNLAFDCGDI